MLQMGLTLSLCSVRVCTLCTVDDNMPLCSLGCNVSDPHAASQAIAAKRAADPTLKHACVMVHTAHHGCMAPVVRTQGVVPTDSS